MARAPDPFLYPTPLGGLRAEWTCGDWEVEVTFDLSTHNVSPDVAGFIAGHLRETVG